MLFSTTHQKFIDKWSLGKVSKQLETHSSFLYWVQREQAQLVLKIYKDCSDEADSARLLLHYDGKGAARAVEYSEQACVLEVVGEGYELVELTRKGDDAQATEVFCDVVKKLHKAPATDIGFRPVDDSLADFDEYLAGGSVMERDLFIEARNVYAELSASQGQKLNLHGDLHHYNILRADDGEWVAIDPKGLWGEAEYEIGRFLLNPLDADYLGVDVARRLEIIEQWLGFDMDRVVRWTFCQAVLATIWSGNQAAFGRHVGRIIRTYRGLI